VKKTTIHQITRALEIDGSTVFRALHDCDRPKRKTKESVLKRAEELGYTRNIPTSDLRRSKSGTIGVVVPGISRYFFPPTIGGIEEVVLFSGPQRLEISKDRFRGYKLALKKYHFPYREDVVFTSRLREFGGREMARKLLEGPEEMDGIFLANGVAAIGAMKYLKSVGKPIPGDNAIVGFGNGPISKVMEPSLTTGDQSGERIGKLACGLLTDKISKRDTPAEDRTIVLDPKLIEKDSTKKLQDTSATRTGAERIATDYTASVRN
jgi:DNA-binding LacI/PurR family transcriptional regulator